MDTRLNDALKVSAKAFGGMAIATVLLGKNAWRQSLREEGPLFTALLVLGLAAYVGLVVFGARWFRIYRTREEYEQQKARGEYRKADESRRAVMTFAFGVVALVIFGVIVTAIESALR